MSRRYRSGSVEVSVDVGDVLDEIHDDHLVSEINRRGLQVGVAVSDFDRDYAERALDALLRNRAAEAAAYLEMSLRPSLPRPERVPENLKRFI